MKKFSLIFCVVVATLMILGIDNVQSYVRVGDTALDFTLISVEGDSIGLSDYLGKVVLLNFFQLT